MNINKNSISNEKQKVFVHLIELKNSMSFPYTRARSHINARFHINARSYINARTRINARAHKTTNKTVCF